MELRCKVGSLPTSYLRLPLGAPHKAVAVRDEVEEKYSKRLTLWKINYISKGGRLTLIRSTMLACLFTVSLFCMPRVVKQRWEKIQRDFL